MRLINILNLGKAVQKHPIQGLIITIAITLPFFLSVGYMGHGNIYMAGKLISYLFMGYFWTCLMLSVTDWIGNLSQAAGKILRIILLTFAIALFITDMFLIYSFDTVLDQMMISLILSADPDTIREFFINYVISPVSLSVTLIIAGFIFIIYKFNHQIGFDIPKKLYSLPVYAFIISIIITGGFIGFKHLYSWHLLITNHIYATSSINRFVIDTYRAWTTLGSEEDIFASMDNNPEAITENNSDIPYVIIVLGESADRNKMHSYGYQLETTPFLDSLISNNEAVAFTDTITPANFTNATMEYLFTFYNKGDRCKWYEKQNLIDIFFKSGYETAWISNQSPQDINDNMDDILAKRSQVAKFTNYSAGPQRPYDEV